MKAMVLAAGRGERLGALTLETPKPLIMAGHSSPLTRTLRGLSRAGFSRAVVNVSHLGEKIRESVGDGQRFGIAVDYSPEDSPLETAGGIRLALERGLLNWDQPFALVNGDVLTDYDFARLLIPPRGLCRLVLIPNPPEHPNGDFSLDSRWRLTRTESGNPLTYAGMGVFSPRMFAELSPGESARLGPMLFAAAKQDAADFETHDGMWFDIGRPESLQRARQEWSPEDRGQ